MLRSCGALDLWRVRPDCHAASGIGTYTVRSLRPAARPEQSSSSTTCTPRARRSAPQRPPCEQAVPGASTSSPSRVPFARLRPTVGRHEGGSRRLQVKGKNVEVSQSIREYAEMKLAKLAKQLAE